MPKDTSRDEAMLNSKKIKPIALAVIKLCLSEGIRKEVSQLVENSIEYLKKKFCSYLFEAFRIIPKVLWADQYCQGARMEYKAGFRVIFFWPENPESPNNTVLPYCIILLHCMIKNTSHHFLSQL